MQALDEPAEPLSVAESLRLLTVLGSAPDNRDRRGIRRSLQSILLLVVGAVMAGQTS